MSETNAAAQFFDALAADYDDDSYHADLADRLISGLQPATPLSTGVDVGCDTGSVALGLVDRLDIQTVVAIDVSSHMITIARDRAAKQPGSGRIRWMVDEGLPLTMDDSTANLITCASTIQFLGKQALTDWLRVLVPGGVAAFTIPSERGFNPSPSFAKLTGFESYPATEREAHEFAQAGGFIDIEVARHCHEERDRRRESFVIWAVAPATSQI